VFNEDGQITPVVDTGMPRVIGCQGFADHGFRLCPRCVGNDDLVGRHVAHLTAPSFFVIGERIAGWATSRPNSDAATVAASTIDPPTIVVAGGTSANANQTHNGPSTVCSRWSNDDRSAVMWRVPRVSKVSPSPNWKTPNSTR